MGNNILASGSYEGKIDIWNLVRRQNETLYGHSRSVTAIEPLTNDGTLFASGSIDNSIKVWNLLTKQCIRTMNLAPRTDVNALVWLGKVDGSRLLASAHNDRWVRVWDLGRSEGGGGVLKAHTDYSVLALAVLSNGLLAMTSRNTIELWNVTSRTCVSNLTGHEGPVVALQTNSMLHLNV